MYLDDFVQIGKVKIVIDDSEMNAKELALHKRDFERTNVTFVRLGAQVEGLEDIEEDEFGQSKQNTLLAKIRKKNEGDSTTTATMSEDQKELVKDYTVTKVDKPAPTEIDGLELKNKKKASNKKPKKKASSLKKNEAEEDGLMGKLKGLFKK